MNANSMHQRDVDASPAETDTGFQIEDGVPLPGFGFGARTSRYPTGILAVGQSFFAPGEMRAKIASSAQQASSDTGKKFSLRSVTENGVKGFRLWRIA